MPTLRTMIRRRRLGIAAAFLLVSAAAAAAEPYPNRIVKLIVPFPAGGSNDVAARIIAPHLEQALGQTVIVDNRPAAGGIVGSDAVAKAPPDGHTLLVVAFPFAVNPSLYAKLPYDTVKDFAPVLLAGQTPNLLVVNPEVPIHSVKELIAAAKAKPGSLSYGSTGSGSSNHLSMELFRTMTGVELVHVPYKGSAPMVTDLLGGHIQVAFDNTPNVLPQVKAGKLRALAITSATRSAMVPDVPTVSEAGVPGYEVGVWFGIVAPAGTPAAVLAKLNTELNRMLAMPDVKQKFADQGVEPVGGSPERFAEHLKAQIEKWTKVVKESGAKVE
jgi:tripartite-type tricarboxylate transporter receptor subunit TctC